MRFHFSIRVWGPAPPGFQCASLPEAELKRERVEGQTAAPLTGVGLRATAGLGHLPPPLTILNSPCSALMSAALRGLPGGGMQTFRGNFILSGQYCCSSPF